MTVIRDLVGHGRTPPDPKWPGDARIAVQIALNYQEGSEYSIGDGDGFSEPELAESPGAVPHGMRDLATESVCEFGSRVGSWRLMRLSSERDFPITVFGCVLDYIQGHDRVWICRREDIARHWIEHHPCKDSGAEAS